MLDTPFSPWPSFTSEEADAVTRVLLGNRVNYWTGQECREFEREFAAWCGVAFGVALNNGTVALEASLRAAGVGPGDEVIVTPRSFVASASSIVLLGARPIFADVDADSQNINVTTIEPVLTKRTKAILCVHLAGWPCEMKAINELARSHSLAVVEDCAQAHGAKYHGRAVGSLGDIAAWSFCQDKIISTGGEGGMVTTQHANLWSAVWSFKDHGKNFEAVYHRAHPPGFRWLHDSFGTNGRMLEMQAAIGRIQLRRMADWHAARKANAERVLSACVTNSLLRTPLPGPGIEHAWYRAYAFVRPEALAAGWSRDRVIAEIGARGVPCFSGSCPEMYLERAFDKSGDRPRERLRVAKQLGDTSLMFLVHPTLTASEITKTAEVILDVTQKALR